MLGSIPARPPPPPTRHHRPAHMLNMYVVITAFCGVGQQLTDVGKCEECPQGTYKDNLDPVLRFQSCMACPVNLITNTTGAISRDNCTRGMFPLSDIYIYIYIYILHYYFIMFNIRLVCITCSCMNNQFYF